MMGENYIFESKEGDSAKTSQRKCSKVGKMMEILSCA